MNQLLPIALSNVVVAALLALIVAAVTRCWKNRQAAHLLWMLVLVKLVTPPLWQVPIAMGKSAESQRTQDVESVDSPSNRTPIETPKASVSVASNIVLQQETAIALPSAIDLMPIDVGRETAAAIPAAVAGSRLLTPHETEPKPVAAAVTAEPIDWPNFLLQVWIVSSGLWLLVAVWRILRFHRIVRRSPLADEELRRRVASLANGLGLRHPPSVRVLEGNVSPMIWPLTWRRLLLLPRRLRDELTPSQLETVIAHELAHLVRRDDLVRFLEAGVTCLFWWNPVVWWARRELHRAEEDCCDALVVCALPDSRRQYGEALLRAAEIVTFGRSLPALASAFAQQRFLKRRIEMILMQEFRRGLSWPFKLLLLAVAVAILPLATTAVSQDEPGTSSNTAANPESSQFDVQATAAQQVDPNDPSAQNAVPSSPEPATGTTAPQSSSAANQSAPAGSTSAADPLSTTPIAALPGSDLLMGGFSWDSPRTRTAYVFSGDGWTFVDLDRRVVATLASSEAGEQEMQGYDIRLRSWTDEIDGRTQIVVVLRDIAYQEWRESLDDLTFTHLMSLAEAEPRSDAIHPGVGIFRTSEGKLGVVEFITEDGGCGLKYQLLDSIDDPIPGSATEPGPTRPPGVPTNPLLDPSIPQVTSSSALTPEPVLQPVAGEPAATVTWPAPHPQAANATAQSISTDPQVQQLELELLALDIESIEIQLDGEQKKLDYVRQLFEQGVGPEGEYQAQQVAVHLLQIELRRASIRRELYQAQIERQGGVDVSGNTTSPSNAPSNISSPTFNAVEPTGTFNPVNRPLQDPSSLNPSTIDDYRVPQADPGSNPATSPAEPEAYFPRPVTPEGPFAIVRGVLVKRGQPIANQVIWILGEENGETVLYQDGPTAADGTFEFSDVPVGRPCRVVVPLNNGPSIISGNEFTLTDTSDATIEVVVADDTVTTSLVEDASRSNALSR